MKCGTGGKDIIDDDVAYSLGDVVGGVGTERFRDIESTLAAIEKGLRWGWFDFDEAGGVGAAGDFLAEQLGDTFGLIVGAGAKFGGVKRDGDEVGAGEVTAKEWVFDGDGDQVIGEEGAVGVFDFVDDLADVAAGTEGADGALEGWVEIEAVGAGAVAFEDAIEGVAAGEAAGVVDAFQLEGASVG